jgi:hypothetical protein
MSHLLPTYLFIEYRFHFDKFLYFSGLRKLQMQRQGSLSTRAHRHNKLACLTLKKFLPLSLKVAAGKAGSLATLVACTIKVLQS